MTILIFDDNQEPNDPGLHEAIATNNLHKVKELLLNGADFKYIGNWACTVLEFATELGFLDIVKTFLKTGVKKEYEK